MFDYYLPEGLKSLKEQRRETEKERAKDGEDNFYPSWDRLRREDREEAPGITLTIRDVDGNVGAWVLLIETSRPCCIACFGSDRQVACVLVPGSLNARRRQEA